MAATLTLNNYNKEITIKTDIDTYLTYKQYCVICINITMYSGRDQVVGLKQRYNTIGRDYYLTKKTDKIAYLYLHGMLILHAKYLLK